MTKDYLMQRLISWVHHQLRIYRHLEETRQQVNGALIGSWQR